MLTERFTLTESVESFLHLCHVDVDLLLYEVLDERTVQRILQRKKNTAQRKSRGKGLVMVMVTVMVMVMDSSIPVTFSMGSVLFRSCADCMR